jgi:hypothetical protein
MAGGLRVRLREPSKPTSCRKTQRLRRGNDPQHAFPTERGGKRETENSKIKNRDSRRGDAKTQSGMHERNRTRPRRGTGGGTPQGLRELHHSATDEPKAGKARPSDATQKLKNVNARRGPKLNTRKTRSGPDAKKRESQTQNKAETERPAGTGTTVGPANTQTQTGMQE